MIRNFIAAAAIAASPVLPALAQELPQLRVAFGEDADAMDPTLGRTYVGRVALLNMCDALFTYNDKLSIVPRLATSYESTACTHVISYADFAR